jgi:polysaccharide pyruvyl transferase WcaK-like protein
VSPRFHNLVLGLMLGKPVLSISYHEKSTSLLRAAGLGKYVHPIDAVDVSTLAEQCRALLADRENAASRASAYAKACRTRLEEQYDLVFEHRAAFSPASLPNASGSAPHVR